MEDDLFLDDDAEEAAPKPKSGAKGKKSPAKPKAGAQKAAAKAPPKAEKAPEEPRDESQTISLMAASIVVICAFVAGLAVGGLIFAAPQQPQVTPGGATGGNVAPGGTTGGTGMPGGIPGGGQAAPPLSQQQQGGGLPKGHPTVPGATPGGGTTKTPSK